MLPVVPAVLHAIVSVQGGAAIAKRLFPLLMASVPTLCALLLVLLAVMQSRLGQLGPRSGGP
ncbi:MAG: hypothetical protein ACRYFR_15150 [Janthinobacterium lividum]